MPNPLSDRVCQPALAVTFVLALVAGCSSSGSGSSTTPAPTVGSLSITSSLSFQTSTTAASNAQVATVTNTGQSSVQIASIGIGGANAADFSESSNCIGTLAPGASCQVNVTFDSTTAGSFSAELAVNSSTTLTAPAQTSLTGTATAPNSPISINTTDATDWKISNSALNIDFDTTAGNIFSMTPTGSTDQLVDTTTLGGNGRPKGFYMDNAGLGSATGTPGYANVAASGKMPAYIDWWITYPSSAANAYTYTEHWVLVANDPGIHVYFVANHAATDIAGSIGQVQWAFRGSLSEFTTTYSVDPSVNSPGVTTVPLPPASDDFSTDPGRQVQDATVDLHGLTLPSGFTRQFYTKYDYAGYEYLHRAHGVYGATYGMWTVLPRSESLAGGPTKQDLYFTGNLLMIEAYSNHLDNQMTLATPAGAASSRLFGPFYIRFNKLGSTGASGSTLSTAADLYADALQAGAGFGSFYDNESQLLSAGYIPSSGRGAVSVQINGVTGIGSTATKSAWAVLSDSGKNFQLSSAGAEYWADISSTGSATFNNVIPGTYRLSVFVLGQFGELRIDGITVKAGATTTVPTETFVPENFGAMVFAIGTPDRSSHEFLHGHDSNGFDDKEYWGAWNYWQDYAANKGAVVYNATAGPAGPATNDLNQWNDNHWGVFNPGLYDATNDTTDNYTHTIPSYVAALSGASGVNGVSTRTPVWIVHFATPGNASSYAYTVLSVGLACDYGSYVVTLNGTQRTWAYRTAVASDCAVRSGLSGYYQWIAFEFPASDLMPAGADNVLTIGVSQTYGAMDDALRLELTNTSAAPSTTGWNDYEYVSTSSSGDNVPANDAASNP